MKTTLAVLLVWFQTMCAFIRAGFWTPTDRTRTIKEYRLPLRHQSLQLIKTQRQYFGRWGKLKWRTERRYFLWESTDEG